MKLYLVLAFTLTNVSATRVDPIQKVIQLIEQLQQKIIKDGEAEHTAYKEFAEWCEDVSQEKTREIKTGKAQAEDLQAVIEKASSDIEDASVKIEELSGKISTDEADLKAATLIREREHKDFQAADAEMSATIDTLARAQQVLEKELGGKASFLQVPGARLKNVVAALSKILEASNVQTDDMMKLTEFLQSQSNDGDSDEDEDADDLSLTGAPDPDAYKSKSGGILDTLADMQEKAEAQQSTLQKEEMKSKFNYDMLKQSITDKISNQEQDLANVKKDKAEAQETKATAEGELTIVTKDLSDDWQTLNDAHHDCMSKAEEFEVATSSRKEELKALATAKKFIKDMTGFAQQQAYSGSASFVQLSMKAHLRARSKSQNQLAIGTSGFQAIKLIRHLASDLQSRALVQLAQRMSAAFRTSQGTNDDPFVKIKEMINEMIAKLVKEAEEEAGQKAFCDKEMSETEKSKADKESDIEDLSTKIEKASAESAKLKEEASVLSGELAALAKSQEEMDTMRNEEHATFVAASSDLEAGLKGLRMALKVLREYYSQDKSLMQVNIADEVQAQSSFEASMQMGAPQSGAASGIIGLLEVAESDFSKNLAEVKSAEEAAVDEYEKITQENKVMKAAKEQDLKYKTKESKSLAKAAADLNSDRDEVQAELDSILEYYEKLKPQCITKAPSYEERKARREKEIAGLKEALGILEGEAV
eukprot:gnl/MRDRNA2_/MRDRNA2_89871_c0_seq1.p1 gnl/MRDRNA2_/MRDRNA2_89871_c0~~gnl/MRDRNA2_/MRDRNA2_89871_c0_seq1.p1  ORF type:complete len:726 (+),score=241.67 gnl/MRDRNA2_/MRDRNA2_89871_c0_seq1:61-2178(+)